MAERPIAPVLKTGNTKVFVGSNPTPSAPRAAKSYVDFAGPHPRPDKLVCYVNCYVSVLIAA